MAPRPRPQINPQVLQWALYEGGLSSADAASRLGVESTRVDTWLTGEALPTKGELTKIAALVKRPASIFFLPNRPDSSLPPALRRAVGREERTLNVKELRQVRRARRTQRILSQLLQEVDQAEVTVPGIPPLAQPDDAGARIRAWLEVDWDRQRAWTSVREAFNAWRDAIELRGVLVMQLQLGNNGLRGFSLDDAFAPLVAVNTAENTQARIFTLLHEIAHLASRTVTSCLEDAGPGADDSSLERWCDRVASAVVLPRDQLVAEFHSISAGETATTSVVSELATRFSVSLRATAIALIQAGLAENSLYREVEEEFPASDFAKGFGRGSPQRAPQRRLSEVGVRAASLFVDALAGNRLTEREARQFLRLDGTELSEFESALAQR